MLKSSESRDTSADSDEGNHGPHQRPYIVYTYEKNETMPQSGALWQRHSQLSEKKRAFRRAQSLFRSGKYDKIEVKKCCKARHKNRIFDLTLLVLDGKNSTLKTRLGISILFAVTAGLILTFWALYGGY